MSRPGPHPASTRTKLLDFFAANPDEELTYEDAITKFGCGKSTLANAMLAMKDAGGPLEVAHVIRLRTKGARRDAPTDSPTQQPTPELP